MVLRLQDSFGHTKACIWRRGLADCTTNDRLPRGRYVCFPQKIFDDTPSHLCENLNVCECRYTSLLLFLTLRCSSSDLQACLMRRVVSRSWTSTPTRWKASTCSPRTLTSRNWQPRRRITAVPSSRGWSGQLSLRPWTGTLRSLSSFSVL